MDEVLPASENSALPQFFQIWADASAQVVQQISGSPVPCAVLAEAPPELPAPTDSDLCLVAAFSGNLRGEVCLRVPERSVLTLVRLFLGDAGGSTETPYSESQEAALELFRQIGGLVTTAVTGRWGQTQFHLERSETAPSWPVSARSWLQVSSGESTVALVEVQLSAALVAALRSDGKPNATSAKTEIAASGQSSQKSGARLDLLMDAELGITLRFGHRRMLLREILDLCPGSVIELDRQVNDPVDVVLDGRVVARGEVVVLDGNYGLRVTELGSTT